MNFWNKEKIQNALVNCSFYNFPENWSASGVRIWHDSINQGDIVFVRCPGETKGAVKQNILPFIDRISAVMCTGHEHFKDLNLPIIEVEDFTKAIFNLGRYIRRFYKGKVITLTGSAGKSTTTRMIYDVLEQYGAESNLNLANTLVAICWNMTTFDIDKKYWVIESSIGHGYVTIPDIAVVTNIAAVHLKEGQTLEGMAKAKSKIFATMRPNSFAILNRDTECYEIFEQAAKEKQLQIITTGRNQGVDIRIFTTEKGSGLDVRGEIFEFEFVPEHLLYDMAQAAAVAMVLNLPVDEALKKLQNFKCLKGRGETLNLTFEGKNITLVDESFNANPLSMPATIEAFGKIYKDNKVMFLGDMTEGGDKSKEYHFSLIKTIRAAHPSRLIFCGSEMLNVYDILKDDFECYYFENIAKLLPEFSKFIKNNDNVFVKSSHATGLHKIVDALKK